MKKLIFLFSLSLIVSITATSCGNDETKTEQTVDENTIYACPMHPEITSDVEGNCSICGMALEKYTHEEHEEMMEAE